MEILAISYLLIFSFFSESISANSTPDEDISLIPEKETSFQLSDIFDPFPNCPIVVVSHTTDFGPMADYFPVSNALGTPLGVHILSSYLYGKGSVPIEQVHRFLESCSLTLFIEMEDLFMSETRTNYMAAYPALTGKNHWQFLVTDESKLEDTVDGSDPEGLYHERWTREPSDYVRTTFKAADVAGFGIISLQIRLPFHKVDSWPSMGKRQALIHRVASTCLTCIPAAYEVFFPNDYATLNGLKHDLEVQRKKYYLVMYSDFIMSARQIQIRGTRELVKKLLTPSQFHIAQVMLDKVGNYSLRIVGSYTLAESVRIEPGVSLYPSMDYAPISYISSTTYTFIPTGKESLSFITCYRSPSTVSLAYLAGSFQRTVWILYGIVALLLVVLFTMMASPTERNVCSIILLLLSYFLNADQRLPRSFNRGIGNFLAILLMFTTFLFTNMHRGYLTSDVTSFLPRRGVETIRDLDGFDFFSPILPQYKTQTLNYLIDYVQQLQKNKSKSHIAESLHFNTIRSTALGSNTRHRIKTLGEALDTGTLTADQKEYMRGEKQHLNDSIMSRLRFPLDYKEYGLEYGEFAQCGKTALFDYTENIPFFHLNRTKFRQWFGKEVPDFYLGTEPLFADSLGWIFNRDRSNGRLLSTFFRKFAIESGIYGVLDTFFPKVKDPVLKMPETFVLPQFRRQVPTNKPMTMRSNVVASTFMIYGVMLAACLVIFVAENSAMYFTPWKNEK